MIVTKLMRNLRTHSVGTKLTDEEFATVIAACPQPTLSEWIRRVLLVAARQHSVDQVILAELLALRAIVVTMHFSLANGEKLTPDTLQRLMALVDDEKFQKASQRLTTVPLSPGR
jgi:hypothetical protein